LEFSFTILHSFQFAGLDFFLLKNQGPSGI